MPQEKARCLQRLKRHGQEHLLAFWDELDETRRALLVEDIGRINFALFEKMLQPDHKGEATLDAAEIHTPQAVPADPPPGREAEYEAATEAGESAIRAGSVAALVVAGGQATRLGHDAPKGTYPVGPVSDKSLFQLFAESIRATTLKFGARIPWYIMTSQTNHRDTVAIFARHGWFGLPERDVRLFTQAMVPVADLNGRILLDEKHRVSMAPNGHGGTLQALADSGGLADMKREGVAHLSYFQVDNPLVRPIDPLFLGMHVQRQAQFSSIAVEKASADERVGVFVERDGRLSVVEYSNFPPDLAAQRTPQGRLRFDLANIAVHLFDREFVQELVSPGGGLALPWHRVLKQVPYVDPETGRRVEPDAPNATKAEMFIFDALARAQRTMVLKQQRGEWFSPLKNATGIDSVATARRDIIHRAAAWLAGCGVDVPRTGDGEPDCVLELSPLFALDPAMLKTRDLSRVTIRRGQRLLLDDPGPP